MSNSSLKLSLYLFILSVVKLFLNSSQKLTAFGNAFHDDRLFVHFATNIVNGTWLGSYSCLTLAKGPMYSMWIAAMSEVGLPLLLAQQLLYICAGLMLILALRRIITNNVALVLVYSLYLFNPMTSGGCITRVIREGIYPALTILVVACMMGIVLRYRDRMFRLTAWAVGLGAALAAFWLTREEGMWLLPGLLLLIAFTLVSLYRWAGISFEFVKRGLVCFLPFLILLISLVSVSLINKRYYGTYAVVELQAAPFVAAYGALSRVHHPHWQRFVPVPKAVRESVYQVSPAFRELKPDLEGAMGRGWAVHGKELVSGSGEIAGGWFMWALRNAAALAGHHDSAASAEAYYRRLAREINAACEQGLLVCGPARRTLAPPFRSEYCGFIATSFQQGWGRLIGFTGFIPESPASAGDDASLRLFASFTHSQLSPVDNPEPPGLRITGWAFSPKGQVDFRMVTRDGWPVDFTLSRRASQDLVDHFSNDAAKNCRFYIFTPCTDDCQLIISHNRSVLAKISLDDTGNATILSDSINYHIDSLIKFSAPPKAPSQPQLIDKIKLTVVIYIAKIYQYSMPILFYFILLLYITSGIRSIWGRPVVLFVIQTSLLISIVSRLLLLSYIDATSFPAINLNYLSPAYPLMLLFVALAIIDLWDWSEPPDQPSTP
jgi:hypothetical protein